MADYEKLKEKLGVVIKQATDVDDYGVKELVANVAEFDEWLGAEEDERLDRLTMVSTVTVPSIVREAVRVVVSANIAAMKSSGIEALPNEDEVTETLSKYVMGWEKWLPAWQKEQEQLGWLDDRSFNDEIYFEDYGGEESIGRGNLFDDAMAPSPELLVDFEDFTYDVGSVETSGILREE